MTENGKEIGEVIEAMADGFTREADENQADWVKEVLEEYGYLKPERPEGFNLLLYNTVDEQKGALVRKVLSNVDIDREKKWKLELVFENYQFVNSHLDKVIKKYEGLACSADKTRWLIDTYVAYLKTGNFPVITGEQYWEPDLTDVQLWMDWMDGIAKLYYGNDEEYFSNKQKLVAHYDALIKEKKENLDKQLKENPRFVNQYEENDKTAYAFIDQESQDKGVILLDEIAQKYYRFFFEGTRRSTYRDEKPEWFKKLLGEE